MFAHIYIYNPFSAAEDRIGGRHTMGRRAQSYRSALSQDPSERRKTRTIVQHADGSNAFDGLCCFESRIVVIGHCTSGSSYLRSRQGGTGTSIAAGDLTARLVDDGVPTDMRQFELLACSAGAAQAMQGNAYLYPEVLMVNHGHSTLQPFAGVKVGVLPDPNDTERVTWIKSFSERFYRSLRRAGFSRAKVTAYLFPVLLNGAVMEQHMDRVVGLPPGIQGHYANRSYTGGPQLPPVQQPSGIFLNSSLRAHKVTFG